MSISVILLGFIPTWLIFVAACISPGPNTFLVISVALNHRRSALWVCLGLALGGFIWAFVSLLGVSELLIRFPQLVKLLALLGGSYLIWMGLKTITSMYRNRIVGKSANSGQVSQSSMISLPTLGAIRKGILTTLSNPKVALLWVSLSSAVPLSSLASSGTSYYSWLVVYCSVIAVIVFMVYGTISFFFSTAQSQKIYLNHAHWFDGIFAVVFMGIGSVILYQHVIT